ncbi:carbohydrate kinase family protein [Flagellimonas algicola]|uniref:Carbohydrate kinase family protein n=2 Tax=Flagellimonas algicola TaxID=2583815 RepID=A0ABY2WHD9_9FLAO|nr:carbohydrate kinase family protein [Allomuricauda algicola]
MVIGELNVDLILNQILGFPQIGEEIIADNMALALGSSSAICASNLSSLGLKVGFIGKLGNDLFGKFTIQELQQKGVDTALIIIEPNEKTGATIALNYKEQRSMITYQGAMLNLGIEDIKTENLKLAKHLHFSSYFLQPKFHDKLDGLFKMAKSAGLTTSLDIQWDPMDKWEIHLEKILPFLDIFMPNETELLKITGQTDLKQAIDLIKDKCNLLVVKRGNKGSILSYGGKIIEKGAFINAQVVDSIGAGDSFNAGFISKYLSGGKPEECQEFGNLTGAISTTDSGGTAAFMDLGRIKRIAEEKFNYFNH